MILISANRRFWFLTPLMTIAAAIPGYSKPRMAPVMPWIRHWVETDKKNSTVLRFSSQMPKASSFAISSGSASMVMPNARRSSSNSSAPAVGRSALPAAQCRAASASFLARLPCLRWPSRTPQRIQPGHTRSRTIRGAARESRSRARRPRFPLLSNP